MYFYRSYMKTIKLFLVGLIVLGSNVVVAQQDVQFTQYNDNMLHYNPAYAGNRDVFNIVALHRQQWVGLKGAPMSTTLSLHTPLKYEALGVGLSLLNDKVGPLTQSWISGDLSYTLRFGTRINPRNIEIPRLSFGIKGIVNMLNADLDRLQTTTSDDPDLQAYNNTIGANVGAGIYYRSEHFFAGASVPRILEPNKSKVDSLTHLRQRHYYATVGGVIKVNRRLKLRPTAMVKITENAPLAVDGSLAFIFYDKFWLAGNYRLLESAGIYAQYQISPQFKIGYGFDISTNKLVRYNGGTHEIMLSYDLRRMTKGAIVSPRFF